MYFKKIEGVYLKIYLTDFIDLPGFVKLLHSEPLVVPRTFIIIIGQLLRPLLLLPAKILISNNEEYRPFISFLNSFSVSFAKASFTPVMRKSLYAVIAAIFSISTYAQTSTDIGVWLDHLPYSNMVDVQAVGDIIYGATEQGLFIYDNEDKSIERLSKINGLNDVGLTCIAWSDKHRTLIIGYENGNVDLVIGTTVKNVPDIRLAGNYTGLKRINHITIEGDLAYICTEFGIVTYDIPGETVDETFIIGEEGAILGVDDVAFANDSIYAATANGLMVANVNTALIFFRNWKLDRRFTKKVTHVENFNGQMIVNTSQPAPILDSMFVRQGGKWNHIPSIEGPATNIDIRSSGGQLSVANGSSARTYNTSFNNELNVQTATLVAENISQKTVDGLFLKAASVGLNLNFYWIASNDGLFVSIRYDGINSYQENITPNSPISKSVYKMYHDDNRLFVAPGGISEVYAPIFNNDGFYELEDYQWTNHPNSEFNNYKDIVDFVTDPNDPTHFYASSYGNGILEFRDNQYVGLINSATTNGAFPFISGTSEHRIGGMSMDEEGNIWFTNSTTDNPLGVLRVDGSVESFSLGSVANSSTEIKNIMYTSQNQVWMQTKGNGVVVVKVDDERLTPTRLGQSEGTGNLPTERVLAFAEDMDGEIWIGTDEGLAVLYSPQNIFDAERNFDAQIIVIDEDGDGNGERVLGSEQINDIEVDGSNKKWFATANSGVFYTSENGKTQIYNFNTRNSPLPSDNVLDIEIDQITGMVYFATDQGIVSFQGGATRGVDNHSDVFAYPNPVTPDYTGPILIRGLVTNAQVKITDIEGNIVFETVAEGGQAIWSGRNFSGEPVTSGVYLAYITNDLGSATAVAKILIVK